MRWEVKWTYLRAWIFILVNVQGIRRVVENKSVWFRLKLAQNELKILETPHGISFPGIFSYLQKKRVG